MPWGFQNDLERAAMSLYPELRNLRDRIITLGFPEVRMSGSGSTLFLAFQDSAACNAAAERLRAGLGSQEGPGVGSNEEAKAEGSRPVGDGVVVWPTRSAGRFASRSVAFPASP